jgi:hypothetical protein
MLLTACGEEKVTSYKVPKEKDPELPAATTQTAPGADGSMAGTSVPTSGSGALAWDVPATWTPEPAKPMRKASYSVPGGCELSVTAFPGDVGGELANVNRWRGQIGLAPLSEADLGSVLSRIDVNGLRVAVADLGGGEKSILGLMVAVEGSTWFFKLAGPSAGVNAARDDFIKFARTLRAGDTSMAGSAVPTPQAPGLAWTAPSGWQVGPDNPMRKATYEIPGPDGACELTITAFPGDVGGELANVNRWRGQIGLSPISEGELGAALTRLTADNLSFAVADLKADSGKAIVGAMLPLGGSTWFFKMTGSPAAVSAAKPQFLDFIRGVRAP